MRFAGVGLLLHYVDEKENCENIGKAYKKLPWKSEPYLLQAEWYHRKLLEQEMEFYE